MSDVTRVLCRIGSGDPLATELLLPLIYDELRKLAAAKLSNEAATTLQATALVHEAYLRLVDAQHQQRWDSRGHFFAAAAQAMRRILVEHARHRNSIKRGGGLKRTEVELDAIEAAPEEVDFLVLDEALVRLGVKDSRKAQLVELRFFSGLTMEQAADVLGVSVATAQRDWTYARAWLHREIAAEGSVDE